MTAPPSSRADAPAAPAVPWHALPTEDCLTGLSSSAEGLPAPEAADRLARFGPNLLPRGKPRSALRRFAVQFANLLIYVLLVAAGVTAFLGHFVDTAVILAVVVVNAVIGFVQEGRAEKALDAIRTLLSPHASVLREGKRETVAAADLVPGDVVVLEAGDLVPADLRLLKARSLTIEEAVLTGESLSVHKATKPVAADAALGDRRSAAFSGTLVTAGSGVGLVVATGASTELGRISALIGTVPEMTTPLLRRMDAFARLLTVVILAMAAVSFALATLWRGYDPAEAFMLVVALAVAAIPEGLPAVMTITLAIGVQRMARRSAIIRRLPAVETLGSVSVICSDKTGTLTRNEMTVSHAVLREGDVAVTGTGYAPQGGFERAGEQVHAAAGSPLLDLARAAAACNDAALRETDAGWAVSGDPMEGALLAFAAKAGIDQTGLAAEWPRIDEIPFDARHRSMTTLHALPDGGRLAVLKGAPERVLDLCATERHAHGDAALDRAFWEKRMEALAERGRRVLGVAVRSLPPGQDTLADSAGSGGFTLLGLLGLLDPPREEAIAAIRDCRTAGIRVVMITGDHGATARAIARELGLSDDPAVVTGSALDAMDEARFAQVAAEASVFARTSPEHKLRLVEAMQRSGAIVAMTGDGVNDAPALKRADVGVAMGRKGTEAAKEASEMVLADDNFASIVAAVREGRTVFDNITKVIAWTLPTNGGEALAIVAAVLLGVTLPMTPLQILWVNLVTATALGLTLAFEPTEPGTMAKPPRPADDPLLSPFLVWRIVLVSCLMVAGIYALFFVTLARGGTLEEARTAAVNTIVVMEIFYLFSVRYLHSASLTWKGLLGTPAVLIGVGGIIVLQLAFTYAPPLQALFATRPLGWAEGAMVLGAGFALFVLLELDKAARRGQ